MRWDVFCRVIDNLGDVGVCWRLCRDLAARGDLARLWIDDAAALSWMAPGGAPGVEVGAFDDAATPGDVVVEAFGCDPPPAFVGRMARSRPVWINLEYLSAEDWVERSHGLPSPQPDGQTKWFFFPGFTPRTGGLLREAGLLDMRRDFDGRAWLAARGWAPAAGERVVVLFCYDLPPVMSLPAALADQPTLLLLTPGAAQRLANAASPGLRTIALPWLSQPDFDRLLWSADLNFVRGEDSLVRAVWAGAPFVWQAYPQHDGVHARKLGALLDRMPPVPGLRRLWDAWNGLAPGPWAWPDRAGWAEAVRSFRDGLASQADLATQLRAFVQAKTREIPSSGC